MKVGKCWVLAAALWMVGCGGTTQTSDEDSGNTNWLRECTADAECGGELSCLCGACRNPCDGASICGVEPATTCRSNASGGKLPEVEIVQISVDPEAYATDLARLSDGSLVLVGGTDFTLFDLAPSYPTFWLERLNADGSSAWQHTDQLGNAEASNMGRAVSVLPSDEIVALSTIYDGTDKPNLRSFDADGTLSATWSVDAGVTRLRSGPGGALFAGGSLFIDQTNGHPFTHAFLGRVDQRDLAWMYSHGSYGVSAVGDMATTAEGDVIAGGTLGVEDTSNAAQPWLARADSDGVVLWEQALPGEYQACLGTQVAAMADGTSLAGVSSCAGPWVRAYDRGGNWLWERTFERGITALAGLDDGGYAVALGSLDGGSGAALQPAVLLRYDAAHRLVWRAEAPGCPRFERLLATPEGLLGLAGCERGYELNRYLDP